MYGLADLLLRGAVTGVYAAGAMLGCSALFVILHRLLRLWKERDTAQRRSRYEETAALVVVGEMPPLSFVRTVARRDRPLVEELLVEYAEKFSGEAQASLAGAFLGIGAVARNRTRARSRFWWVRADAAHRLGLIGQREVVRALRPRLTDNNLEVRIAAARSLVKLGADLWLDDLVGSLAHPDLFSGLRLADVILEAGTAAVPSLLRFVQRSSDGPGVALALDILGDMRSNEAAALTGQALRHSPSKEVRAAACRALGRIESPEALSLLCRALGDDAWEVRGQAVRALGQIGDPAALPLILPMLEETNPWTVYNAGSALARLGSEGTDALRRALKQPRTLQRAQILQEVLATQLQEG